MDAREELIQDATDEAVIAYLIHNQVRASLVSYVLGSRASTKQLRRLYAKIYGKSSCNGRPPGIRQFVHSAEENAAYLGFLGSFRALSMSSGPASANGGTPPRDKDWLTPPLAGLPLITAIERALKGRHADVFVADGAIGWLRQLRWGGATIIACPHCSATRVGCSSGLNVVCLVCGKWHRLEKVETSFDLPQPEDVAEIESGWLAPETTPGSHALIRVAAALGSCIQRGERQPIRTPVA